MGWIEEREQLDASIPDVWDLLCIAIEQSAEQFGTTAFARAAKVFATATRINTCIRVVLASVGESAGKAIEICFDRGNRRVFSRANGKELVSVRFAQGVDGNVCIVDSRRISVTPDRAAEIFLREFLFGEPVPSDD